jgi:hypothetical protein
MAHTLEVPMYQLSYDGGELRSRLSLPGHMRANGIRPDGRAQVEDPAAVHPGYEGDARVRDLRNVRHYWT